MVASTSGCPRLSFPPIQTFKYLRVEVSRYIQLEKQSSINFQFFLNFPNSRVLNIGANQAGGQRPPPAAGSHWSGNLQRLHAWRSPHFSPSISKYGLLSAGLLHPVDLGDAFVVSLNNSRKLWRADLEASHSLSPVALRKLWAFHRCKPLSRCPALDKFVVGISP